MVRLLGDKVRYLRQRSALTQVELTERLGMAAQSHVASLEAGRDTASLDLVVRLARVFGVTTDYLLRDAVPVEQVVFFEDREPSERSVRPEQFGAKLRMLGVSGGCGQTMLARKLGLARRGYISNLEAGRKMPSLDLAVRIADLFGVATDDLLRDELTPARGGHDAGGGSAASGVGPDQGCLQ